MPAEGGDTFAQADESVAAADGVRAGSARGVGDLDESGGWPVADAYGHRSAVGVLAGIGQCLLDDAVHGQAVSGGSLLGRAVGGQLDVLAGGAGIVGQFPHFPHHRREGGAGRRGVGVAQYTENIAQIGEGFDGCRAQQAEAFGDRCGQCVALRGQHTGVQGDEAQAVGQDVVHLGGDAGPFRDAGRFLAQLGLDA